MRKRALGSSDLAIRYRSMAYWVVACSLVPLACSDAMAVPARRPPGHPAATMAPAGAALRPTPPTTTTTTSPEPAGPAPTPTTTAPPAQAPAPAAPLPVTAPAGSPAAILDGTGWHWRAAGITLRVGW